MPFKDPNRKREYYRTRVRKDTWVVYKPTEATTQKLRVYQRTSPTFHMKRIMSRRAKRTTDRPGFLYFFRSITPGYYKVGCCKDWQIRKTQYHGPSAIKDVFFARPVRDRFDAESHMKIFLLGRGYRSCGTRNTDWLMLEDEKVF